MFVEKDVGLVPYEHLAGSLVAVDHDRDQVGHGAAGNEESGFLAQQLGHASLETWDMSWKRKLATSPRLLSRP